MGVFVPVNNDVSHFATYSWLQLVDLQRRNFKHLPLFVKAVVSFSTLLAKNLHVPKGLIGLEDVLRPFYVFWVPRKDPILVLVHGETFVMFEVRFNLSEVFVNQISVRADKQGELGVKRVNLFQNVFVLFYHFGTG